MPRSMCTSNSAGPVSAVGSLWLFLHRQPSGRRQQTDQAEKEASRPDDKSSRRGRTAQRRYQVRHGITCSL
eukprot:307073-Chlamydomonas_euryale.AAC.2